MSVAMMSHNDKHGSHSVLVDIAFQCSITHHIRDRPFILKGGGGGGGGEGGYGFLFRSEFFFRTTQELEYLFFCRALREFFFQNSTLGYMTKTLNQIIFFSSTKIRIFFSAIWGIRIFFFRKKTYPPPLQVKWSFPNTQ